MENLEKQEKINSEIKDRKNIFYWQTDRKVEPKKAGEIWADRHKYFTDEQIIKSVNSILKDSKLISLTPLDYEAQTSLGNVNSVRIGKLDNGEEVIIRNHPTGIENGYFYSESLISLEAKKAGVPSYDTFTIHDLRNAEDHSFQVIEKLPGVALNFYLEENPEKEEKLLLEVGKTMANLHQVGVSGFGPFDNEKAKKGKLEGMHEKYEDFLNAGLDFNLDILQKEGLLNINQIEKIKKLFKDNPLLKNIKPVLVHNDFADWNLLTDGKKITGVVDFDEAVGGDPVQEIACWGTFFEPERLDKMLKGYFEIVEKPEDFQEKFELFRLRYVISKMTLRIRRYSWDPTDFMKEMIEKGQKHLEESLKYFKI